MFRVYWRIAQFLLEELGIALLFQAIFPATDQGQLPQSQENFSQQEMVEIFTSSLFETENGFEVSDFEKIITGRSNSHSATIQFETLNYSADADTIYFTHRLIYINQINELVRFSGEGFVVWKNNLIQLNNIQNYEIVQGSAFRIYNERNNNIYIYLLLQTPFEDIEFLRIKDSKPITHE